MWSWDFIILVKYASSHGSKFSTDWSVLPFLKSKIFLNSCIYKSTNYIRTENRDQILYNMLDYCNAIPPQPWAWPFYSFHGEKIEQLLVMKPYSHSKQIQSKFCSPRPAHNSVHHCCGNGIVLKFSEEGIQVKY